MKAEQEKFENSTQSAVEGATKLGGGAATFATGSSTNTVTTNIDQGENYKFSCKVRQYLFSWLVPCEFPISL